MSRAPGILDPSWTGGPWGERAFCQLCPNPSPMTLEGTNTWILQEPGSTEVVVIDPGPLDEAHLRRVEQRVAQREARVALTLLTHGHWDHAESAQRWAELTAAPVRAIGRGHDDLAEGELVRVGGLELLVVPTPGHTADSVSFLLPAENVLLTGDTILGRGSTVVAHPDGELGAYLESLRRLEGLTQAGRVSSIAPGHGPVVPDAAQTVRFYLEHRRQRLEQVRAVLAEEHLVPGPEAADHVVEVVYADVPREVRSAARLSVLAQLSFLAGQG